MLLPAWLDAQRAQRQARLLQYAGGSGACAWAVQQRIEAAIAASAGFFKHMGMLNRLSEHGLDAEAIFQVLDYLRGQGVQEAALEQHERLLLQAL